MVWCMYYSMEWSESDVGMELGWCCWDGMVVGYSQARAAVAGLSNGRTNSRTVTTTSQGVGMLCVCLVRSFVRLINVRIVYRWNGFDMWRRRRSTELENCVYIHVFLWTELNWNWTNQTKPNWTKRMNIEYSTIPYHTINEWKRKKNQINRL